MSTNPLVSVITIFLNEEKFIQEAIESVFAQTYDNWELLLVDDGSIDASTEIARRYAEQHPGKVRYLKHDGHRNRGKSASRNLGISNATGEYIAFLDADDVWLPQNLEKQVPFLEAHPEAAMLFGPTKIWYSWTGNPEDVQRDRVQELGVQPNTLIKPPTLLTHFLPSQSDLPCTCSTLVRREIIDRVGGFEEVFRDIYEDMVFHAKVYLEAPVIVTSECWAFYRQHPGNSWRVAMKTGQWHPARPNPANRSYFTWIAENVAEQGIKDAELRKALQKALWPYRHPNLHRLLTHAQQLVGKMKWHAQQLAGKIKWLLLRLLRWIALRTLPVPVRRWLRVQWQRYGRWPPLG